MSLFDNKKEDNSQSTFGHDANFQGIHPIDDAKKLMAEVTGIVRDIRKMVDKMSRAMKIMGE